MIAVHSLIRLESRNSACVNSREFADKRFILLLRCQNLKHCTLHRIVDLDLGLCLISVR